MISTFVVTPPTYSKIWSFEVDYIYDLMISAPLPVFRLLWVWWITTRLLYSERNRSLEVKHCDSMFNPFMQALNPVPLIIIVSPNCFMTVKIGFTLYGW